jgi:hypothetical protein
MSGGEQDYMKAFREHQKMKSVFKLLPAMKPGMIEFYVLFRF